MHGNCCKQKIENNKKIKFSKKLLEVKESTSVEGGTNKLQSSHVNHKAVQQ